jgi:hypothetical protein
VTEPDVPSGTDGLVPSTLRGVPGAEPRYPRARTVRFPALFGVPGAEPGVPRRARTVRPRTPLMGCEGENQEYPAGHERFTVPGVPTGAEERARSTLAGAKGPILASLGVTEAIPQCPPRCSGLGLHRSIGTEWLGPDHLCGWNGPGTDRLIGCTGRLPQPFRGTRESGPTRSTGHRRHGPAHQNSLRSGPGPSCPGGHTARKVASLAGGRRPEPDGQQVTIGPGPAHRLHAAPVPILQNAFAGARRAGPP